MRSGKSPPANQTASVPGGADDGPEAAGQNQQALTFSLLAASTQFSLLVQGNRLNEIMAHWAKVGNCTCRCAVCCVLCLEMKDHWSSVHCEGFFSSFMNCNPPFFSGLDILGISVQPPYTPPHSCLIFQSIFLYALFLASGLDPITSFSP